MLPGLAGLVGFSGEAAPAVFTLGNTAVELGNLSTGSEVQNGAAWQAAQSFTAIRFFIRGRFSGGASTFNFRLCIYAATSQTVWSGALLGQTNAATGINQNELKEMALQSPVNIVSGNWYALTIQAESPGALMGTTGAGQGDRFFSDAYANGPAATASASALNSGSTRCLYISS